MAFELIEEKTNGKGLRSQVWEDTGYGLRVDHYPNGAVNIRVFPDLTIKYLPYIYVHTDDEGHPTRTTIQTTSYGSLPVEEYKVLQRVMTIAIAAAEAIESQFIHN